MNPATLIGGYGKEASYALLAPDPSMLPIIAGPPADVLSGRPSITSEAQRPTIEAYVKASLDLTRRGCDHVRSKLATCPAGAVRLWMGTSAVYTRPDPWRDCADRLPGMEIQRSPALYPSDHRIGGARCAGVRRHARRSSFHRPRNSIRDGRPGYEEYRCTKQAGPTGALHQQVRDAAFDDSTPADHWCGVDHSRGAAGIFPAGALRGCSPCGLCCEHGHRHRTAHLDLALHQPIQVACIRTHPRRDTTNPAEHAA